MGSGKSTIGSLISQRLNLNFIDIDNVLENEAKMKISEIFKKKGEVFFRNLEEKITLKILRLNHSKDNIDTLAIAIENYSYGSKGQALFQIAENCGILKYRLAEEKYKYSVIVPSVVKKLATGKGNADKEMMYEQFCKDTKTDLKKLLDTTKANNPISDIVDSWYIAKAYYEKIGEKL